MLMFGVRAFPVGKELEGSFNSAIQKLEKEAANPQPKPNPEMAKIQAESQLGQQKMQQEAQLAQQKAQLDAQVAQAEQQAQAAQAQQQNQLEAEREQRKLEAEMQIQREKMQAEGQIELQKAYIQQKTAIAVARIGAKDTDGALEEAEADQGIGANGGEDEDMKNSREIKETLDRLVQHITSQPQGPDIAGALNNLAQAHAQSTQTHAAMAHQQAQVMNEHSKQISALHQAMSSEKEIVRDPKTGKPTGVRIKQAQQAMN
jgi:hypothetical protein